MQADDLNYTPPETLDRFMCSSAYGRIAAGPVGSGKTTACLMELFRRACEQRPASDGLRWTRFAVVRQTLKSLKDTVLKDCETWLSSRGLGVWKVSESTFHVNFDDVRSEWVFLPLEDAQDQARLLSMQLTGAWLSECIEMDLDILGPVTGRVGRYPSGARGQPTWTGIIADTNLPTEMTPWQTFMENLPADWDKFVQPSGMAENAENLQWLTQTDESIKLPEEHPVRQGQGRKYYERLVSMHGAESDWVKRYVYAQYGDDPSGAAVFKNTFKASFHTVDDTLLIPGYPLIVGQDFGRNPWSLICQPDHMGRLLVHEEIKGENVGLEKHVLESLKPRLYSDKYVGWRVAVVGDPAGIAKGNIAEETCFDALKRLGLPAFPAPTNLIEPRLRAVEALLGRQVGGGAAVVISRRGCPKLVRAMSGGYRFIKTQQGALKSVPDKNDPEGYSHVCFVAGTRVMTLLGERAIETLHVGDLVATPMGPRRISATGHRIAHTVRHLSFNNGAETICTPDHPFWTQRGWTPAAELTQADTCFALPGWLHCADTPSIRSSNSTASAITVAATTGATPQPANACTWPSGSAISALSRPGTMFTTRMATAATTIRKIWSACTRAITTAGTCWNPAGWHAPSAPSGMRLQPLRASAAQIQYGPARSAWLPDAPWHTSWPPSPSRNSTASTAVDSTLSTSPAASAGSAHHDAKARQDGRPVWTTKTGHAPAAGKASAPIDTRGLRTVHCTAVEERPPARVYNITVEDAHCYYANGLLVSNCDCLQYAALIVHGGMMPVITLRLSPPKRNMQPRVSALGWT